MKADVQWLFISPVTFRAFVEKKIIHHRATEKHKEIINIKKTCVLRASVVHFYHKDTEKHK